jgi:peptidoglycan hydrolase CwlO-like protein
MAFNQQHQHPHRADNITVPIMTPTSPTQQLTLQPYSAASEDFVTTSLLSLTAIPAADLSIQFHPPPLADDPASASIKSSAQAIVDAQKFNTRKAFKVHLDEEIARLSGEVEERARRRRDAMAENGRTEEEIKKLEGRYETERRALEKRMGR